MDATGKTCRSSCDERRWMMRASSSIKSAVLASILLIGGLLALGSPTALAAGPGPGRGPAGYHGGGVGHASGFYSRGYHHGGGPGWYHGHGGWYRPFPYPWPTKYP